MSAELLHWLWKATLALSLAALIIVIARQALRRWLGSEAIYALWLALPVALAVSFMPDPPALVRTVEVLPVAPHAGKQAAPAVSKDSLVYWDLLASAIWLAGCVGAIAGLTISQQRYVRRLRLRRERDDALSLTSGMPVFRAENAEAGPALLGAYRFRLVLPADFEQRYSATEQLVVMLHERVHARRRDGLANAGFAALRAVFWFNPLLQLIASLFVQDQELACDAAVMREVPGERRAYAEALLKTADHADLLPIGCHWHCVHPLKERIQLLNRRRPGVAGTWLARFAIASLLAGSAWSVHALQPRPADQIVVASSRLFDVALTLSADGKQQSQPRLMVRVGESAGVRIDGERPWSVDFRIDAVDDKSYRLKAIVKAGAALSVLGAPALLERYGETAAFEISGNGSRYRAEIRVDPHLGDDPVGASPSQPATTPRPILAREASEDPEFRAARPVPYPAEAIAQKTGGELMLEVEVLPNGNAGRIKVVSANPPGVFEQVSIDAVRGWHFRPALDEHGRPTTGAVRVPLRFQLDDDAPVSSDRPDPSGFNTAKEIGATGIGTGP